MDVLKRILAVVLVFIVASCATTKQVPVQTIEKVEYRDSIVVVRDSIWVKVPHYKEIQILPEDTTSVLTGKISRSTAFIQKGELHHTLEEKGSLKAKIDTFFVVEYVDRIIKKEIPIEVEVEKKVTPTWCWYCLIYSIILTLLIAFKLYLKKFR